MTFISSRKTHVTHRARVAAAAAVVVTNLVRIRPQVHDEVDEGVADRQQVGAAQRGEDGEEFVVSVDLQSIRVEVTLYFSF